MTDEITTVRAPRTKDRPYFSMARAAAQDERLSWEARGVLAYLLSKPDDWQVSIKNLQQHCGRDKVRKILDELQDHQYLTVEQVHDKQGKFARNQYRVYELPFTENPSTVSPSTAKPPLTNKRGKQNRDKTISPSGDAAQAKPAKTKKPRPRNLIFDAVALGSFDLADASEDKTAGARIGKIVSWLKQNAPDVTPERVEAFYSWYADENGDASAPRDAGKFAEWWLKFEGAEDADSGIFDSMFAHDVIVGDAPWLKNGGSQ